MKFEAYYYCFCPCITIITWNFKELYNHKGLNISFQDTLLNKNCKIKNNYILVPSE